MSLIKESLHHSIDLMSDAEAETLLIFVRAFHQKNKGSGFSPSVSPAEIVQVPVSEVKIFKAVNPVSGKGASASSLLIAERR